MKSIRSPRSVRICPDQTLKLGDQAITVTDVKWLDQNRTVYRLEIEPVNDLPPAVVVKQQKEGWSNEFEKEEAYGRLKDLQGDMIPQCFGLGYFDGIRALVFSEVVGTTLLDLARSKKPVDEENMKDKLTAVFKSLSTRGAIYWDQKLDNFMYCDNGGSDASKVMVLDFEQVEFPTSFPPWKLGVNNEGARTLMEDFRDIRDRYHGTSPARPWELEADSRDEENMSRTIQSSVIPQSMNSGSIEAL
ncbi:uncharacterized protein N7515_004152 [Penicillium bovifimosum]|uniref:Protein kinase domain-containing protein n=1 Tax=Penicillium bovifimosum TaxID=126998 RepID=A0A9W9L6G1_9EURO|nr:uncharacterized protein N7515_004152 [Penicillium bovifimosum]KAJ5139304.1 hypothetical protein N7515_004152 [Penicillium bovifimosum]